MIMIKLTYYKNRMHAIVQFMCVCWFSYDFIRIFPLPALVNVNESVRNSLSIFSPDFD